MAGGSKRRGGSRCLGRYLGRLLGLLWCLTSVLALEAAAAEQSLESDEASWLPARRKSQFSTEPGHILTPAAANIPGIGFTYGLLGSAFNLNHTETDLLGFRFWGDLSGIGLGALEVPLYVDELTLNVFWNSFQRAAIETHRRGIQSNADDRSLIELDRFEVAYGQINYRLFQRRLQLNLAINRQETRVASIRNKDGDLITKGDGDIDHAVNRSYGSVVDLTDDRADPRRGVQLEVYRYDRPKPAAGEVNFYTMDYNGLFYIPVGSYSTWAFNVYRSDAVVTSQGETDAAKVREELAFDCGAQEDANDVSNCEDVEERYLKEQLATNRYGTASPLGGTQRLRSYVTNRYYAAHALSLGTEFRWNLTEEFTPFNIFVASGVRTGVQLAAFAETGTVADQESDLDRHFRHSYGLGVRLILASGFVVRLDIASGSEGTQPNLIFQYPWAVF